MSWYGPFPLEVVDIVLELSYAGDSFCCPMTFSLRLCHLKAYFLELCSTIPLTFKVGAPGYTCFVSDNGVNPRQSCGKVLRSTFLPQ